MIAKQLLWKFYTLCVISVQVEVTAVATPDSPPPSNGAHLATASALAATLGAVPAALLGSYKFLSIGIGVVTMVLYLVVALDKLKSSLRSANRKFLVICTLVIIFAVSWSVTGWAVYRLHGRSTAAASQQDVPSFPPPMRDKTVPAQPTATTINEIHNDGTLNPVITGSNGPIYIGNTPEAHAARGRHESSR